MARGWRLAVCVAVLTVTAAAAWAQPPSYARPGRHTGAGEGAAVPPAGPPDATPVPEVAGEPAANLCQALANDWRDDLVGNALYVSGLSAEPGFAGAVCYLHAVPWGGLFAVRLVEDESGDPLVWREVARRWRPSDLFIECEGDGLVLREQKVITRFDVSATRITIQNASERPRRLVAIAEPLLPTHDAAPDESGVLLGAVSVSLRQTGLPATDFETGFALAMAETEGVAPGRGPFRAVALGPGETATIAVALALRDDLGEARRQVASVLPLEDLAGANALRENEAYAATAPTLTCSDPAMQRVAAYRWFLLRKNAVTPQLAYADHPYRRPCLFEARGGEWLPRVMPRAAHLQLLEARWLRDPSVAVGQAWTAMELMARDLDRRGRREGWGALWMSIWRTNLVQPDAALLTAAYPLARRDVERRLSPRCDADGDRRPETEGAVSLGMGLAPSFLFFTEPRFDHTETEAFGRSTTLERVDELCYLYLDIVACRAMADALGKEDEAAEMDGLAKQVSAALAPMWDPATRFFYSLDAATDRQARVREPAGFLPFVAGLATAEQVGAFAALDDPQGFAVPFPVPSVSVDCPAFCAGNQWRVGPDASPEDPYFYAGAWNGPTWPLATCQVVDGLAAACRLAPDSQELRESLARQLSAYTRLHLKGGDAGSPCLVDEYDPLTGEWLGSARDDFASVYNDLFLRHVCGLQPRPDETLEVWPIDIGLAAWSAKGVPYKGRVLDLAFERGGAGLTVAVDGKPVASQPELGPPVRVPLPPAIPNEPPPPNAR
jgi:hypothetical protein